MKRTIVRVMIVFLILMVSSCSTPQKETPTTETEVVLYEIPTHVPVSEVSDPDSTQIPNPVTGSEPTAQPEVEIIPSDIPGEPIYTSGQEVNDCSTGERLALGATTLIGSGCDVWTRAKLERPADSINGDYIAALDIVRANMGSNQTWVFGKIELFKTAAGNLPGDLVVGFEIDTDINSRGNFLVLASGLTSSDWTTSGVQIWQDQNNDIGGKKPHSPDEKAGDGYETLLFDSGRGEDPDFAWVRIDPMDGANIEFAFKASLMPENLLFAWWAWTAQGNLDPANIEVVDSLAETEVWRMDNTCGWIFNGKPTNILVNICEFVVPTPIPTITPTPKVQECVIKTDAQCNAEADPHGGGFPWWFDKTLCKCRPTN